MSDIRRIFHGSDHTVSNPAFGKGKPDNDYGSGFYTTEDIDKAREWAATTGDPKSAVINEYSIDLDGLNVLRLDEYGVLAWIAETIYHRGSRNSDSEPLENAIIKKYKIDTSDADVIIGYRADDSYIDIVDAFLQNKLSIDEVERLFKKGDLGEQIFIKSKKAFDTLTFERSTNIDPKGVDNAAETKARMEVFQFLKQRNNAIMLDGFEPTGIVAKDAVKDNYIFNKETQYYEISQKQFE